MRICLVHAKRIPREVLTRALASRLGADIEVYSCCENALACSLDHDVFVVYNNFRSRMSGVRGVAEIRARAPDAFIVGVSGTPDSVGRFLSAGADASLLRAGNEIEELVGIISREERSVNTGPIDGP